MFKDEISTRRCTSCDGLGYTQNYTEKQEAHSDVVVRTITEKNICFKCNATGIEQYTKSYALIKNIHYSAPIGVEFNVEKYHFRFSAIGWTSIFRYLAHVLLYKLNLCKIFGYLRLDYDGDISFDVLSYHQHGGDYMMPDYYSKYFSFLGFCLACDYRYEPTYLICKQCGKYAVQEALCLECKFPRKRIVIDLTQQQSSIE